MNLKPYLKYKPSGIGWMGDVPHDWNLVKTSRHFKIAMGQTILKEDLVDEGEWPVFSATDGDHYFGRVDAPQVRLEPGDLVIPARGNSIGAVKLVHEPSTTTQTTIYCKNRKVDLINGSYVHYFMRGFRNYLFPFTQTAIPQITVEEVSTNPLLLPPVDIQRSIVSFLDRETAKIDTLIAKQEKLIELLKEKRQAVISHTVTKGLDPTVPMKSSGVEWLGDVPEHWEVKRIKFLANDIKAGPFGSAITKDMYVSSGYRVYGQEQVIPNDFAIGDYFISSEHFESLRQYEVVPGDILISCVGTFGKIAVVPGDVDPGIINPRLIRLRLQDTSDPSFVATALRSSVVFEQFSLLSRGGTMDVINIGILNDIVIAVPPKQEQQSINNALNASVAKIDKLIGKAEQAIILQKEHRTALISAAVTGKIDVRERVSNLQEAA